VIAPPALPGEQSPARQPIRKEAEPAERSKDLGTRFAYPETHDRARKGIGAALTTVEASPRPAGHKGDEMNWDQIEGKWKQVKGKARQRWGEFTDDDVDFIEGKKEKLIGKLQERKGIARAEAEREVEEWGSSL
jgi:uncharacterized protein YjbJ (UPF0337 family)